MSPNSLHSSEFFHWFVCCVPSPPPRQRRKIDRTMIGNPTDFRHTAHMGTDDLMDQPGHLSLLQTQMSSKNFIVPMKNQHQNQHHSTSNSNVPDDRSTSSNDFT